MIGTDIGNYRILDLLSSGGMGAVYRAEHALLGRIAAVKVLLPELCSNKDIVNRFFNEAKATTAINHPGIVEIFDFGYMPGGQAYLVMEFLDGMSLARRMKLRGPVPEGEAAMVMRGACSALAAAHGKGIVHRDLKPDNIFIIPDADSALGERCKLLDFGIAKLTDIGMASSATKTGSVMGTPTYMSPEQCKGRGNVDQRADLYSIGCILYELVAGVPPFHEQLGAGELIGAHLFVRPDAPTKYAPHLSPEMAALIMRLLEKDPDARVQTARDLGAHLTQIAQRSGWSVAGETLDLGVRPSLPTLPPMFTPVFGDAAAPPVPTPVEMKPTTLSAATGVTHAPPAMPTAPKRKTGLVLGVLGGAIVAGGIVAAVMFAGGGSAAVTSPPAAAVAPLPAPVPVVVAPPPPPPPPVAVVPPAPEPVKAEVAPPKPPEVVVPAHKPAPPKVKKPDPKKPAELLENDL